MTNIANIALTLLPHTINDGTVSTLDTRSIDDIKDYVIPDFYHDPEAIKVLEGYITRRRAHEAYDDLHPHLAEMNELEAQTFIAMLNRALIEGYLFDAPSDDEIEAIDDSEVH